jgi:mannosyltransferase OCH1-like enzyme
MIPNVLWQTWKTLDIPAAVEPFTACWDESNPDLELKFMDDAECSGFILEHFGHNIHTQYNSFPQNIMRADFWRIAVVYVYGGYYADLDVECNTDLATLIKNYSSVDCVFIEERKNIANFFFGCAPNHPVLKNTLDMMLACYNTTPNISVQDFGMHPLHHCVREYFKVADTDYLSTTQVCFLNTEQLKTENKLIHWAASLFPSHVLNDYESWRQREISTKANMCNILFFTTFNKNGYDLYGQEWVSSFLKLVSYYNTFTAKIYYEGFEPTVVHPSIEWINYETVFPNHPKWKTEFLSKSQHSEYIRTMTVRFSHKAFVIQHALENNTDDYLIWLDGDCVFKIDNYDSFPSNILGNKLLACQLEKTCNLNHIESGILIFNGLHPDKITFSKMFGELYRVDNIVSMREPYDGFVISRTLEKTKIAYIDLNDGYSKGGIQSDPNMTFNHPEIKSKFIHNIGWTGKTQYKNWNTVLKKDYIYKILNNVVNNKSLVDVKRTAAFKKLKSLKELRQ